MMTRPTEHTNRTQHTVSWQGGIAIGALIASCALSAPAFAQAITTSRTGRVTIHEIKTSRLPVEPTLHQVPGTVQPIFDRAADMLRIAEKQVVSAPSNARPEFAGAVHDLRQMLYIGGYSPNVASDGSSSIGNTPSSRDIAYDVQTMRSAAHQMPTSEDARLLNRAANLYASAARKLMTGDLRVALAKPGGAPSVRALDRYARKDRQVAQAGTVGRSASNELPPVAARRERRSTRPVTVVIHGSVQDQRLARQQGQQSLHDILAEESRRTAEANAAASAAATTTEPVYGYPVPGSATTTSPVMVQQAALAAAQQAAAQQAYLNQGQNQLFAYGYYPYGYLGSPLTPFGGNPVPTVPTGMPAYSPYPVNALTPAGGIVLGPGMSLIPNPLYPTQISPQPIVTLPIGGNGF